MSRHRRLAVVFVIAVAVCAAVLSAGTIAPQNQPGPSDSPSDGSCYCSVPLCGCASPGPSFDLTATCTCGATCSRTCTYTSKKGS